MATADQDVKLRTFARTPSSWDPQDDILLRRLKEQQKLGWKEIASHFTNRTPNACQFRWRRLRSGSLKNVTPSSSSTSIPTTTSQAEDQKISIQPKSIVRRHSILSTTTVTAANATAAKPIAMISSTSRSGSFTDLQSTNSVSSNESNNGGVTESNSSSNVNQDSTNRQRSYSTTSTNTSASLYHADDPLSSSAPAPPSQLQGSYLSHSHHHHHLQPHHLRPLNSASPSVSSSPRHPVSHFHSHHHLPAHAQQPHYLHSSVGNGNGAHHAHYGSHHLQWEDDEDELLLQRRERELSFTELSILLPAKSETDIWQRIEYLETARGRKNSITNQLSRSLSISSSISNVSGIHGSSNNNNNNSVQPPHHDLNGLLMASRENSIVGSIDHPTLLPSGSTASSTNTNNTTPPPIAGLSSSSSSEPLEKDTKKRSIKLPSLGSILNTF